MKPDAPEFTIARLIANAQAMVIKISHEMYLVYLRAGKSLVHAIITVVTAAKKNISSSTPGNSSSIKGNSPTVAPTIINTNLGLQEIERTYSSRVHSRLAGMYAVVQFRGRDIRLQKKQEG